jgi:hypothetical protein
MDRNQVRIALLKITMGALALSTWVFWSFIFATRPEVSEDALVNLVRLPASLPSQIPGMTPLVRVMDPIAMDVVHVPCWDQDAGGDKSTAAHWVRLTGRACGVESDDDSVSVVNTTNGFSATILPAQKALTTDYIPLESGRNEIMIRFQRDGESPVERKVSFVRE